MAFALGRISLIPIEAVKREDHRLSHQRVGDIVGKEQFVLGASCMGRRPTILRAISTRRVSGGALEVIASFSSRQLLS